MSGRVGVGGGVFGQTGLPLDGGTITGALTLQSTLAVTGAVTMSSTLAVTGAMTLESTLVQTKDAIGTGATAGNTLRNTTDAAAGAQQYSPMFVLTGEGWKTDATAATQVWDWAQQNRPVEGAAASTSALHWLSQVAGGGYTSRANLSSAGAFTASGALAAGAATPGPYLYVKGPTDVTSYARVDDSTGNVQTIFGANNAEGFAGTLSNYPFVFRTNNTARLTFAAAGAATFSASVTSGATTEKIYIGAVNGYPGIWFGNITPTTSNFNFLLDASYGTLLNAPASQTIYLQIANTSIVTLTSAQLTFTDAVNIAVGTTTGTKIGTAATQKLGFWNAAPVAQPAGIADADGTLADITTKFNTLITALETLGLIATV